MKTAPITNKKAQPMDMTPATMQPTKTAPAILPHARY